MNPPELYNAKYLLDKALKYDWADSEDIAEYLSTHLECYDCPWEQICINFKDWHDRQAQCKSKLIKFINKGEIEND